MKRKSALVIFSAFFLLIPSRALPAEAAGDVDCVQCVNQRDIAFGAVGTGRLRKEAVNESRLASASVSTDKIQDSAVDWQKLAVSLQDRILQLEDRIADLETHNSESTVLKLDGYLDLDISDPEKPTARFAGVNVQIINGNGQSTWVNGLGNLVIGYDELMEESEWNIEHHSICSDGQWMTRDDCEVDGDIWAVNHKSGSHNLVVGPRHRYSQAGGLLGGSTNAVNLESATVSGGWLNVASGFASSVSGGRENIATGASSAVSGGYSNSATNHGSAVSGGYLNSANGQESVVSGGYSNAASGERSVVSGGFSNTTTDWYSVVSGGQKNSATGFSSVVSGGGQNTASGQMSSVSGGYIREASGDYDWVAGSLWEDQ